MLNPGNAAPDFSLKDAQGNTVTLSQFRGRPVVLFFYPRDGSPGCTAEACAFREDYSSFEEHDAVLLGISDDTPDAHARFASRHDLPYPLLSDPDRRVAKLYDVPRTLGIIPGRVTYVIDREGAIAHAFSSQLRPTRHVREALESLERLAGSPSSDAPGPS